MRKLIFALALGAILLPNHGFTLGLGEIEVSSSLNQTLAARIDLISAIPEDAETLIVKLASREEFVRAGLDRPQIVTTLKFKIVVENGRVYIDVMTPKPIREPFLNFLVEIDWPKGHLIREYTILLDPPVFMGQNGVQKLAPVASSPAMQTAVTAAPVGVQSTATAGRGQAAAAPVAAGAYAPAVATQQTAYAPSDYRIQQGDTAWSIANKMRPDASVSTQQMLMALLRANPEVFINQNVNGLKRGYILRMPDQADITALSSEEARDNVRQQNALWREYQQSMASDQPASAIEDGSTDSEYRTAVSSGNGSRLAIVSAGAGASASGEMKDPSEMTASELREQLALARERVETERVEKEALQKQVSSLATQVDKMKGLIAIEDDVMAEMQAAESSAGETPLVLDADVEEAVEETDFEQSAEDSLAALEALTGESQSADEQPAVTDEVTQELFVDPAEQAVEMEAVTEQDMPVGLEPDYAPPQEAGLIDALLNNKMIVGGLLIVLLVIGAIAYLIKRRRDNASSEVATSGKGAFNASDEHALEDVADMIDDESIDDLVSDEQMAASMAEAEAEEEAFDAEATMILPSGTGTVVTTAASLQPEEEEEQDDVMAEADVYLAYGIYQQAEELLRNAIKEHPEKDSYRVKLAETYFAGKNADAFAKLGAEMKQRLGNAETPAWLKVVAMGKELCPEAEVFQQASVAADLDINDLMPKSPEPMDFDLGEVDDGAADLDLDFDVPLEESADEISFDLPAMDMDETAILSSDNSASSLDELEFDLSETDAIKATPAEEEFSLDISAAELDLDTGLDFDMSMDDLGGTDNAEAVEFDLSDEAAAQDMADELDMNVDAADLGLSMEDDLGDMDLLDAVDVDEVNTKLDLAKAYLDMGDHEGARDILDEVMAGGNAQQKKEAQELLAQAK